MPPVKKTAEEKAAEKAAAHARRLEILAKLAKGELTAEDADKQLNAKSPREWEVVASPDGKKVMLKGIYTRFPLTIWPAHIKRMQEEGYWEQMVVLAEELLEKEGDVTPEEKAVPPAPDKKDKANEEDKAPEAPPVAA